MFESSGRSVIGKSNCWTELDKLDTPEMLRAFEDFEIAFAVALKTLFEHATEGHSIADEYARQVRGDGVVKVDEGGDESSSVPIAEISIAELSDSKENMKLRDDIKKDLLEKGHFSMAFYFNKFLFDKELQDLIRLVEGRLVMAFRARAYGQSEADQVEALDRVTAIINDFVKRKRARCGFARDRIASVRDRLVSGVIRQVPTVSLVIRGSITGDPSECIPQEVEIDMSGGTSKTDSLQELKTGASSSGASSEEYVSNPISQGVTGVDESYVEDESKKEIEDSISGTSTNGLKFFKSMAAKHPTQLKNVEIKRARTAYTRMLNSLNRALNPEAPTIENGWSSLINWKNNIGGLLIKDAQEKKMILEELMSAKSLPCSDNVALEALKKRPQLFAKAVDRHYVGKSVFEQLDERRQRADMSKDRQEYLKSCDMMILVCEILNKFA